MVQGAYSCEAINSMGSCFAGSAGCGQPGQDAILVVNTGGGVCPRATFSSLAATPAQCLPCHCFGHTDSCRSADLHVSVLAAPRSLELASVSLPPHSVPVVEAAVPGPGLRATAGGWRLVAAQQREATLYLALPPSHAGNLLKSYGANLRFNIRFNQMSGDIDQSSPLIIIVVRNSNYTYLVLFIMSGLSFSHGQGEDKTLSYFPPSLALAPDTDNTVTARLWPGSWVSSLGGAGGGGGAEADRADMMAALARVETILVRDAVQCSIV